MTEPEWIALPAIVKLHDHSIARHGGAPGLRDVGLLESALARPQNRFAYEGVDDVLELAATYAVAIASNHPFADGNKRAGFAAMLLFLRLNGFALTAGQDDAAGQILSVAAGALDIDGLTAWLRANIRPADPPAPAGA